MTAAGSEAPTSLRRFSSTTRAVHRTTAMLMMVCIVTAAVLYNGSISIQVGHRRLVEIIHVYSGFALPVPVILGFLSSAYRNDVRRLNRFTPSDWRWLRSRKRRDGSLPVGKFNAGQKLNAALSGGSILVLLGTGLLMYFPDLARLTWRTGATFVHDWFALALGLLVVGHIVYAIKDPEARRGMRTGQVSALWARDEHGEWAAEAGVAPSSSPDDDAGSPA
jgi:formate dehydrogenase subunit gamma